MTITTVVFDIGNVLFMWDPRGLYARLIGAERTARLFAEVPLDQMNIEIDAGRDFDQAVSDMADAHPQWRDEVLMWRRHWLNMVGPVLPGSVALLRALRAKGVPVFALSNFGVQPFEVARMAMPFLDEFDRCFISGEIGINKPQAGIYAALEKESNVAPSALIFVDDKAENIEAAVRRGWAGHVFDGPEGWAARLVSENLLSADEAAQALGGG